MFFYYWVLRNIQPPTQKFEQVEKPETSGVTKLGGKETKWVKPAHKAAKVSFLPSKRKSLEIEI